MNELFMTFKIRPKPLIRYKPLRFWALFFVFLVFSLASSQAQNISIRGTVTAEEGPLPGVNVVIKGTNQGTITDPDGKYNIKVTDSSTVLVFSFVGYETVEEPVGDRTTINVVLHPANKSLEEVIVTGYGTSKRKNLTSAVAQIDDKDIKTTQATSIAQKLSGKVAGLNIRQ